MADDLRSRALRLHLAEEAYGSVAANQYAQSQQSAQANEAARRLGIAPDLVESDMSNMLAEDRMRKRIAETQHNAAYARIMSNRRLAAAAIDDDELPKVAERADTVKVRDLGIGGVAAEYARSLYRGYGRMSAGVYNLGKVAVDTIDQATPDIFTDIKGGLGAMSRVLGRGATISAGASAPRKQTDSRVLNDVLGGAESILPSISAMVGTILTRNPAVGGVLMGTMTAGESAEEGRKAGMTPVQALTYGTVQAVPEVGFEMLGGRVFLDSLSAGLSFGRTLLRQTGIEVATEVPTTLAQSTNRFAMIGAPREGQSAGDWMAGLPDEVLSTVISTISSVGMTTGGSYAAGRLITDYHRKKESSDNARRIDALMGAAATSPTRTSNPSDFREALNQIVGEGRAYVPVQAILDDIGETDAPIAEHPVWGPYAQQIADAQALGGKGGDVVIPLADAVTDMAGTTSWEAIKDQVRDRPQGQSIAEAKAKRTPEELQKLADEMGRVVQSAVPAMQARQALRLVKNFGQTMLPGNASDTGSNIANRVLSDWLVAQFNRKSAKRTAAGLPAITMDQFAEANLPTAERMLQKQYEAQAAGRGSTMEQGDGDDTEILRYRDEALAKGWAIPADKLQEIQGAEQRAANRDQADAGTLRDGGRVRRGFELLDGQGGPYSGLDDPVVGAPQRVTIPGLGKVEVRPLRAARQAAIAVARSLGLTYNPPKVYAKLDEDRARRIAQAFEDLEHNPSDPATAAAYSALRAEVLAQYQAIKATGLEIEFIEGDDPYPLSPRQVIEDVHDNNHMWVFPTVSGFGAEGSLSAEDAAHPMLQPTDEYIGDRQMLLNDVFRIVHDYFGHVKDGHGFRAEGEENAWQSHAAMFSPLARRAMTTETRGQNSWVNYGPNGIENQTAKSGATDYADQKVGLLPEWVSEEGFEGGDARQIGYHGTPYEFDEFRTAGGAVWFSATPQLAASYADGRRVGRRGGDRIIPAALSFKNPLVIPYPPDGMVQDAQTWAADTFGFNLAAHGWQREGPLSIHAVTRSAAFADAARGAGFDALSMIEGITQTWGMLNQNTVTSTIGGQTLFQDSDPRSPAFKAWFGDSAVVDADGDPLIVYHGTTGDFDTFNTRNGNIEGDFGAGIYATSSVEDASANYAGEGPDLTNRIERWIEQNEFGEDGAGKWTDSEGNSYELVDIRLMAKEALIQEGANDGFLMPIYISMQNPLVIGSNSRNRRTFLDINTGLPEVREEERDGETVYLVNDEEFADEDEAQGRAYEIEGDSEPTGKLMDLIQGIRDAAAEFDADEQGIEYAIRSLLEEAQDSEGLTATEAVAILRDKISYVYDPDTGDSAGNELIRMAAEKAGFDGIIDNLVNNKFGSNKKGFGGARLPGMAGMDENTSHYIVFRSQQVKSALGNNGNFDANSPNILNQLVTPADRHDFLDSARAPNEVATFNQDVTASEEVFYSAAQRVVAEAKQAKATAQQWKALLTPGKTPGIKSEEIEWTAIHDWLDMQTGQIEKGALLQVLRDRGIRVEEVMLGGTGFDGENSVYYLNEETEYDDDGNEIEGVQIIGPDGQVVQTFDEYDDAQEEMERLNNVKDTLDPQFKSWSSDPSNDTYRELLITIPLGQGGNPSRAPSTHWDTEAVVAHARFMDKADADGKRVLFIEEVQSDWHQKGRDEGYAVDQPNREAETKAALEAAIDAREQAGDALIQAALPIYRDTLEFVIRSPDATEGEKETARLNLEHIDTLRSPDAMIRNLRVWSGDRADEIRATELRAYEAAQLRENEANQAYQNSGSKEGYGIPEAPFKSSWPALVMKRMIRYAAENGYERIAWTTGKEQAERYNLGQRLGTLTVILNDEGNYSVDDSINGMSRILPATNYITEGSGGAAIMSPDQIKEAFGQDLGGRMMKAADEAGAEEPISMSGEDLTIGGEGMRAFYDRNLVNITNDIVKKYGAKVGPVAVASDAAKEVERKKLLAKLQKEAGLSSYGIGSWAEAEQRMAEWPESAAKTAEWKAQLLAARPTIEALEALDSQRFTTTNPGFDITPKLRDAAGGGFTLFQKKRGNISIQPDSNGMMETALIRAFESANFSTAIHELGHFFLEDLRRRALASDATDQEIADWQAFKQWGASLGQDIKDDSPIPVDAHEYFARGFERYTWEGKAPTAALRGLFLQLREFMKKLYTKASQFDAPITPEIREVMGRMIASDAEVAEQTREMNLAAGKVSELMTPEERRIFADLNDEAREDARDKALERALSALRQEKTAEVRERKEQIKQEVSAEVDEQPLMRALKLLKVGIPQTDGTFIKVRLGREQLKDAYGDDVLDTLPRLVPEIHSDRDAQDLDTVAGLSGFASGDAMVRALQAHASAQAEMKEGGDKRSPRARMIDEAVEDRVRDEIGDPFENLEEEAQAALANERQADALSLELRAIARKTGKKPTPWKLAKEFAAKYVMKATSAEAISGKAIQMYTRNATKAGQEATEAIIKGDMEEAFAAKQRQLLNLALLSEAKLAKDKVEAAERRLKKIANRPTIPSVDQDYLEQAQALLEDVSMGDESRPAIERRKSFEDWYLQQVAEGKDPVVPMQYAALLGKGNWKDLTIEDFLELDGAVTQIIALGKLKQTLRDGNEIRDFNESVVDMVERINFEVEGRKITNENDPSRSFMGALKSRIRSADSWMVTARSLVSWFDGNDTTGPWHRLLLNPFGAAQGRADDLMREYGEAMNGMIEALPKGQLKALKRKVDTPELINNVRDHPGRGQPFVFHMDQILVMAMNWGNDGNRQRLLDGFGWQEAQVEAVFDRLMTKEYWDFVAGTWEVVNRLWPDLAAMERRVNGVAPEKVEGTTVETKFGTYEGGYFPIVYDSQYSSRVEQDQQAKLSPGGGLQQVAVRSGASHNRVEAVKGRPLLLSIGLVTNHMTEVVHDITHREAVGQAKKILTDDRIRTAIITKFGKEYHDALSTWVKNIANPGVAFAEASRAEVSFGRHMTTGMSVVGLGLRITTILVQPLGLLNVASRVGGARLLMEGVWTAMRSPVAVYNEVTAKSAMMRARFSNIDTSMQDIIANNGNTLEKLGMGSIFSASGAFRPIAFMDSLVTTAGWIAAYNQGLQGKAHGSGPMTEEEAIAYADDVILSTQGGGGVMDRAAMMNANPFVRMFYPFFSFANAMFNQQRDAVRLMGKEGSRIEGARRAWWVFVVPVLVQALLFGEGPEGGDDDEVTAEDWLRYLAGAMMVGNTYGLPFVGPLVNGLANGYGYRSSAIQSIGEDVSKVAKDLYELATEEDEEVAGSTVKKMFGIAGITFHKALGQPGTTIGGGIEYARGNENPEDAGDWYELLAKGRTSKGPTSMEQLMGEEVE